MCNSNTVVYLTVAESTPSAMGDRVILVVLVAFLYTVGVSSAPECDCNAEFDASGMWN